MSKKPLPDLDPTKGYFTSLTLENVRCFGLPAETLLLTKPGSDTQPARWTVILGPNGVGKTTVLRVLSFLSAANDLGGTPIHDIARDLSRTRFLARNSNTNGEFILQNSVDGTVRYEVSSAGPFRLPLTSKCPPSSLIVAAYGAGRAWRGTREKNGGPTDTLFDRTAQVRDPSKSLADWTTYQLLNPEKHLSIVENFKDALVKLLPDVDNVELDFDDEKRPYAKFKTIDGWISLDDMSWGYQVFAAFTTDYASRLIEWYPDSKTPLEEPGICLVDELDLHMHPTWQRKVIDQLSDIFPATQFIVTVHSPLVVQAAEDANLVVLRRYKEDPSRVQIDNDVEAIKGWRIDQVLTSDLFGLESARPPSVEKFMSERHDLLAKDNRSIGEDARLADLNAEAMVLPNDDQDWEAKAKATILEAAERMRLLG